MIGPLGHIEQLPPYSKYPTEAYVRKAAAVEGSRDVVHGAAVVPPILTTPASAIPPMDGAGGIGLATRNPEFESTEDLDSPRSRHSTRSFTSDDSHAGIRLDDEGASEKKQPPKKWQTWMRRKVCGIVPYWAMCLTAVILTVMLVVLGAVVGTFVGNNNNQKRPPPWKEGDWQPPYDATPVPTPPDLQPLATGTFGLGPLLMNRVSNTCFQNPTLSQAWNCRFVISGMTLRVTKDKGDYHALLDYNHSFTSTGNVYAYGEQPPLIENPLTLELVQDKFEPSRGPAWFKMLSYNKTVIVPEGFLVSGHDSNARKRARHAITVGAGMPDFKRKGIAQPGEKPWVCNWPDTWLELFIYPQQNSSYSNWPPKAASSWSSSSSTPSPSTTTPPPPPPPPPSSTLSTPADVGESSSGTDSFPPHSYHKTDDESSRNKPYYPPQNQNNYARSHDPSSTPPPEPSSSTTASTTATSSSPWGPIDTGADFPPLLPPYPRVIKLEERRMSTQGAPRAQCTQVEIRGAGEEARPVRGPDGKIVVVDIDEIDPFAALSTGGGGTAAAAAATGAVGKRSSSPPSPPSWGEDGFVSGGAGVFERDGLPDISPCGCTWFLT